MLKRTRRLGHVVAVRRDRLWFRQSPVSPTRGVPRQQCLEAPCTQAACLEAFDAIAPCSAFRPEDAPAPSWLPGASSFPRRPSTRRVVTSERAQVWSDGSGFVKAQTRGSGHRSVAGGAACPPPKPFVVGADIRARRRVRGERSDPTPHEFAAVQPRPSTLASRKRMPFGRRKPSIGSCRESLEPSSRSTPRRSPSVTSASRASR
jgi:hypothetical protein